MGKITKNGKKVGPKYKYDHEKLAQEVLDWSAKEHAINFTGFCAERGYLPELIWRFERDFPEFKQAYTIARMRLAERRERLLNQDLLNYGSFQRYQGCYDPFLRRDEDDEKDKDAKRRKGVVEHEAINLATLVKLASEGKISQKD